MKMSELKPEQLQEFKVTFSHFDIDKDNLLSPVEFRAGCRGLGIDLTVRTYFFYIMIIQHYQKDEELDSIIEDLDTSGDGYIQFEEFTKFMVSRTQIRDTHGEILVAFSEIANRKVFVYDLMYYLQ